MGKKDKSRKVKGRMEVVEMEAGGRQEGEGIGGEEQQDGRQEGEGKKKNMKKMKVRGKRQEKGYKGKVKLKEEKERRELGKGAEKRKV